MGTEETGIKKILLGFKNGITSLNTAEKLIQERMYSEEDLLKAFEAGHDSARLKGSYKSNGTYKEDLEEWFEQFKKK
jgi:hypothetical protein